MLKRHSTKILSALTSPVLTLTTLAGLALAAQPAAHAQLVTFTAFDPGAGISDPRPNSDAEAAMFDAAAAGLGPESLITFEAAPVGSFSSLTVAPGVTLTGTDYLGSNQSIQNAPGGSPSGVYGYNTTSGGANYLDINGGTATFSFTNPIQAFGAYFTGVQLDGETITFTDGTSQSVTLPNPDSFSGGVAFVGFTDAGKQIASLTINTPNPSNELGDFIGVDDVRFVGPAGTATPEPASYAAFVIGGLGLLGLSLKNRKRRSVA